MSTPPKRVRLVRVVPLLLVCLLVGSACGVGTAASSTPTTTALPTTAPPTTTLFAKPPTPTHTPVPEWVTYLMPFGGHIDIPGVLQLDRSSAPVGHGIVGWHDDQNPLPSDHPVAAELDISLDAADVTDQVFLCRTGTRITVGPGIIGYQRDGFSSTPTSSNCSLGGPVIEAFWITAGICYDLNMGANYSGPQGFMTRYGAIWQHMLASVVPPPPPAPGETTCS